MENHTLNLVTLVNSEIEFAQYKANVMAMDAHFSGDCTIEANTKAYDTAYDILAQEHQNIHSAKERVNALHNTCVQIARKAVSLAFDIDFKQ